jgi:hypothetical protein
VEDATPITRNHEEGVKHAEGERRDGEEVHRGNSFAVIAQECRSSLCRLWISRRHPHLTRHCTFRNVETEHLQLTVNSWRTPNPILGNRAKDQLAQFPAQTFSSRSGPMSRNPYPIQLAGCPIQANDGLRLDENQCLCQPAHNRLSFTQNSLSLAANRGCTCFRLKTPSCAEEPGFPKEYRCESENIGRENDEKPQQVDQMTSFICQRSKSDAQSIHLI